MEKDFLGFYQGTGGSIREDLKRTLIEYTKKNAPERYHDVLIPRTEIDCKRKAMEKHYLGCLHRENFELVHPDPIEERTETGVRTQSGREVHADAIILAHGFQTQQGAVSDGDHGSTNRPIQWEKFSSGSAQAYHGTCVSEFPNLFILMGPNTTTGHLSSFLDRVRNQFHAASSASNPGRTLSVHDLVGTHLSIQASSTPNTVAVTHAAEQADNNWIQAAANKLV